MPKPWFRPQSAGNTLELPVTVLYRQLILNPGDRRTTSLLSVGLFGYLPANRAVY